MVRLGLIRIGWIKLVLPKIVATYFWTWKDFPVESILFLMAAAAAAAS